MIDRVFHWLSNRAAPIRIIVEDCSGERRIYGFSWRRAARGLALGSDPACDIRLRGQVLPVHVRLQPMSNHWVLKYLPEGQRLPLAKEFDGQYDDRVDRTQFEIAGNRVTVWLS